MHKSWCRNSQWLYVATKVFEQPWLPFFQSENCAHADGSTIASPRWHLHVELLQCTYMASTVVPLLRDHTWIQIKMVSQTRWSSTRGGWGNRWSFATVGCIMPYIIFMKISCLEPVFTRKKWMFTTFQPTVTGIFLARWITPLPIQELFSFQGRITVAKFHAHQSRSTDCAMCMWGMCSTEL